eukprot:CAMPEP_0197587794 /NCGR_PEP_ID=MMETSP1326-20131121/9291_1 /TAXON_ID=1155430 /ORGANISM="Genus nov. species nov., Strain RCC2288" /LENGTH=147 /DNA_ID=CAMNT_0043152557 /DNA_START=137 /DNA_END=580 /DNA_ORIENTATION=+
MTRGHTPLLAATYLRGLDDFELRRTTAHYRASDIGESGGIFGVVQVGANQFKVSPDDLIFVEKLPGYNVNDNVLLPHVLLLSSKSCTIVGRPSIENAKIHAVVEEHVRDVKKLTFKKKRRKGYQRLAGHRQELTALRITQILGFEDQ